MKKKNKWICPDCCWYDGRRFCLKGDKYNFDGEGVNSVSECAGFVKTNPDFNIKQYGNRTYFDIKHRGIADEKLKED